MLFICFNHQLNQNQTLGFFPSRLVFEGEREYASNLSGAFSSEPPLSPEPPPPAVAAPAEAPVSLKSKTPAPAVAAAELDTRETEAPREGRRRLRSAVDAELERRINEFKPQIEALLENPTENLRAFVRGHTVFEVGKDKATAWNLAFARGVLDKTDASPRDAQCAAYALQHVLNDLMQKNHKGAEYPFRQERDINTHTRLDGYIGGYTVSVLAGYLNFHQPDEGSEAELLNYAYLEGGKTDHRERYAEAMGYLDGIFGEKAAAAGAARAPERVDAAYRQTLADYEQWLSARAPYLTDTKFFNTQKFQQVFSRVVDYVDYLEQLGTRREDFDQVFNEMGLTAEEIDILFPPPDSQPSKSAEAGARPKEGAEKEAEAAPLSSDMRANIETMFSRFIEKQFESNKNFRDQHLNDIKEDLRTMEEQGPDYTWYVNNLTNDSHIRPGSWPRQAFKAYETAYKDWQTAKKDHDRLKGNPLATEEAAEAKASEEKGDRSQQEAFKNLKLAVAAYFAIEEEVEKKAAGQIKKALMAEASKYDFPPGIGLDNPAPSQLSTSFSEYRGNLETFFEPIPNRIFRNLDDVRTSAKPDKVVQLGNILKAAKVSPLEDINNGIYARNLVVFRRQASDILNSFYSELAKVRKESDQTPLDVALARGKKEGWTID